MSSSRCCCIPGSAECGDCISTHVITDESGCCHSSSEALVFRILRPEWSVAVHAFGNNPIVDPPECPGGCEVSATTTWAAADAIQAYYPYERSWFKLDRDAIDTDRPPRSACGEPCVDCCPLTFPPYVGCVCDEAALLSPYQKGVMEVTPQFMWLLDSICYDGTDCFPYRHTSSCDEIPVATTLFGQLIGVVHFEHHWKLSECSGAVTPPLAAPNDPETPVSFQCIGPKRWVYACSGVPIYEFDLLDAVTAGVITEEMFCQFMEASGTPHQSILQALWDAGYLKAKDWRPEIVAGLTALKAAFPDAYSGCTVPACADLDPVGPVRKMYWPCLDAANVATHTEGLQPSLGDCGSVDPFSGVYPESSSDPNWEMYRLWLWTTKAVYFHARPGGWSWICADPGVPDKQLPDVPHRYSVSCDDNNCLDVSGYPQDWSCAPGAYDGVHPDTGLVTCPVGCGTEGDDYTNEYGCIFADIDCTEASDGSRCENVMLGASCDGIHFAYSTARVEGTTISDCYPVGRRYFKHRENHAYLFGLNRTCGDWATECHKCRRMETPTEVANLLPDVQAAALAIAGLCNQLATPECGQDGTDLPCGTYCLDGDGCTVVATAADCEASPTYEERTVCP